MAGWTSVDACEPPSLDGCQDRSGKAEGRRREGKGCSVRVKGRKRLHPRVQRCYFHFGVILGRMDRGYE